MCTCPSSISAYFCTCICALTTIHTTIRKQFVKKVCLLGEIKQKTVAKSVAMLSNSKLLLGVSKTDFDFDFHPSKIAPSTNEPI